MANFETRVKFAAQIAKAEMLGDRQLSAQLKEDLAKLDRDATSQGNSRCNQGDRFRDSKPLFTRDRGHNYGGKVNKFLKSSSSLGQMFEQEKRTTTSDEARMFVKTSSKFSREDMETKYFSREFDDSEAILDKARKRHKLDRPQDIAASSVDTRERRNYCNHCIERQPKHLLIDRTKNVYLSLNAVKTTSSGPPNVIIRNIHHAYPSLVASNEEHQSDVEQIINRLRSLWSRQSYRCIIMETHMRRYKPSRFNMASCADHFQIHCIPIKEKYYEQARMTFKKSIQDKGQDSSVNKTLITTTERRIQRCLPDGLSYFWVCFDKLTNGFGHVVEDEIFHGNFGFSILSDRLSDASTGHHADTDKGRAFILEYEEFKSSLVE